MSKYDWAITGIYGLYYGTYSTRKWAIKKHTDSVGYSWNQCRKNGDRAIKVLVIPYSEKVATILELIKDGE